MKESVGKLSDEIGYTYVKFVQILHFKCMQFIVCQSIKLFKKKKKMRLVVKEGEEEQVWRKRYGFIVRSVQFGGAGRNSSACFPWQEVRSWGDMGQEFQLARTAEAHGPKSFTSFILCLKGENVHCTYP